MIKKNSNNPKCYRLNSAVSSVASAFYNTFGTLDKVISIFLFFVITLQALRAYFSDTDENKEGYLNYWFLSNLLLSLGISLIFYINDNKIRKGFFNPFIEKNAGVVPTISEAEESGEELTLIDSEKESLPFPDWISERPNKWGRIYKPGIATGIFITGELIDGFSWGYSLIQTANLFTSELWGFSLPVFWGIPFSLPFTVLGLLPNRLPWLDECYTDFYTGPVSTFVAKHLKFFQFTGRHGEASVDVSSSLVASTTLLSSYILKSPNWAKILFALFFSGQALIEYISLLTENTFFDARKLQDFSVKLLTGKKQSTADNPILLTPCEERKVSTALGISLFTVSRSLGRPAFQVLNFFHLNIYVDAGIWFITTLFIGIGHYYGVTKESLTQIQVIEENNSSSSDASVNEETVFQEFSTSKRYGT